MVFASTTKYSPNALAIAEERIALGPFIMVRSSVSNYQLEITASLFVG